VHWAYDTRIYFRMCQSLAEKYDVTLIACNGGVNEKTPTGIKILSYPRFRSRVLGVLISWLLVFFRALKVNARVYHLHDPELIPTAILLRLFGKKVIFDIHENIAEDIFDKKWIKFPRLYYSFFAFFEVFATKFTYIVLAEKSYEKRYKERAKKYSIIYNYCDYSFFEKYQNGQKDPLHLFYSGILFENRGMLQICEAISTLEKKHGIKAHFHCVGPLYRELRVKMEILPFYDSIKERLHFYGRKKLRDSFKIGENCGIGLSIIHPMSNSIESYPTKIFEYMATGMPTIASDFKLYKSIVEEVNCGLNVPPLDSSALAAAIKKLIEDKGLWQACSSNGMELAKAKYSWELEKQKLFDIYANLLNA